MTADEYCEMSEPERRRYDYEMLIDRWARPPEFAPTMHAPEPSEEDDAAFQAARREAGGGPHNERED